MRLIAALMACGHLKAAHWHDRRAGVMLERIHAARSARRSEPSTTRTVAAAERMLIASIVGLGIAFLWCWIAWRAML